jgi:Arc/MetJ-type ribon-helix-helix transcriptional regulator
MHPEMGCRRPKVLAVTTEPIAVRLPEEMLARLDALVGRGRYPNRVSAVRQGIELLFDIEEQREIDVAMVDGYRRLPQTDPEHAAAVAALRASILEEPW